MYKGIVIFLQLAYTKGIICGLLGGNELELKAVILDLDGTLLNSMKSISPKTMEVLKAMKAQGIHLIFATARPPRVTHFEEIDLASLGTVIFYNGALFRCPMTNETIHFSIPRIKAKEFIDYCILLDKKANLSIEVKDEWYSSKLLDYREMMKVTENPKVISYDQFVSYDTTKILLTDFQYKEELVQKYGGELNIVITDFGELIQVMALQSSKESAVKYVLETLKIKMSEAMCFGDDFNDLGLFQTCGYSVAMGNAIKELKDIANEVTNTNDEDGVALILERYMKNKAML